MAVLLIQTRAEVSYQTQKTRLDGRDYILRFAYNEREDRWYLSILDEEETPLVEGVKLIANWPLLRGQHHDPRVPPGQLMAGDLTGDNSPPGFAELGEGKRVQLYYFTADALA